jgi:hypothetical protein
MPPGRTYYDGPALVGGDISVRRRYFTIRTETGIVAGSDLNVMFTIDRPSRFVWPHFKDFNRWQNPRHYYSGVVGDLEGGAFAISAKPDYTTAPQRYRVLRVIPEYLIVVSQSEPGPGFHLFTLNDQGAETVLTVLVEHASMPQEITEQEALASWRDEQRVASLQRQWPDFFIPNLKRAVYGE